MIQGEIDRCIPENGAKLKDNIRWARSFDICFDYSKKFTGYFRRLVNIGGQGFDIFQLMPVISSAFPEYYQRLVRCESVQCQTTGTTFPAIRSPTLAIIDVRTSPSLTPRLRFLSNLNYFHVSLQFFLFPALMAIRALTGRTVPVLAWDSGAAFYTLRLFCPEELGGLGDISAKARMLAEATGRKVEEIADEVKYFLSL